MTPEEIYRAVSSPTSLVDTSTSLLNHYREGTPLVDRDKSIIAQNAGSTAAAILTAGVNAGAIQPRDEDELLATYDTIRTSVFNGTFALAGAESVVESFEGGGSSAPTSAPASGGGGGGSRPHADVEVRIGKYRGKTIGAIHSEPEGADWLDWASQNLSNDWLKTRIREFLAA